MFLKVSIINLSPLPGIDVASTTNNMASTSSSDS